ncbi:glycosyltransferase, partial [bacterium]|nr:glycosyltransferase [bacterium]
YTIVLGLDLKQSAKAFGATLISVLLMILLFRSKGVLALILYVIVGLISFGGVWAYYTIKPITNRPNISISDFLKQRKQFSKTQKIYFKKPKERI